MNQNRLTRLIPLILCIALLSATAAGFGIFARGAGTTVTAVSPHGMPYQKVVDGIYANNSERIVAEGVGWDFVTLFFAVPVLIACLPGVRRGSLRARLLVLGLLAYLFYQYLEYAVFWSFGPLFPLFILIYALSLVAIAGLVATIPLESLPDSFGELFPRRSTMILTLAISALLILLWSSRIAAAYGGEFETTLYGHGTMVVQALDLGLIVPLAIFTAVALHRRRPIGYLLAPVLLVKAATMALAICAMLLSAWQAEGVLEWPPLLIFTVIAGLSVRIGCQALKSIRTAG